MSKTPRTDKLYDMYYDASYRDIKKFMHMFGDLARKLECELAEKDELIAKLQKAHKTSHVVSNLS
jgi:hypothetical protein